MANMNNMARDLDALHTKLDAIMEALGVTVSTERQKRMEAQEKAAKAYREGGKGWKQMHSNPFGEGNEPDAIEGVPTAEDMKDPEFAAGFEAGVEAVMGTPGTVVLPPAEAAVSGPPSKEQAEMQEKAEADAKKGQNAKK